MKLMDFPILLTLRRAFLSLAFEVLLSIPLLASDRPNERQIEFFEKKVRPVLAQHCLPCHGPQSTPPMGGLRLDSRAALLKGGDSGPAIVPGSPETSRLTKAISYRDLHLKMPPTGKLSDQEIADLSTWVKMGAPDPREDVAQVAAQKQRIDMDQGRLFWAFRPIQDVVLPTVRDQNWIRSPIDWFVLAALEAKGLKPAAAADSHSWLRRVTLDLIGLPPTVEEIEAFLTDASPAAKERVVERLLASPHYGERWGRHWLDLVRFAETNGHEFDNDKIDAWRYRDYVIRAFNEDVPYNQFVMEHIAGDLLPVKRRSVDDGYWESTIGTSFFWFGEVLNGATDSLKSRADEVDNQIDVMTKTFLGLTGACARCHDHKFDPIPTSDYYALAGFLHSTTAIEAVIDSPGRAEQIARLRMRIKAIDAQIRQRLRPAAIANARQFKDYVMAAAHKLATKGDAGKIAEMKELRADLLTAWVARLQAAQDRPEDIFYPLARMAKQEEHQASKSASFPSTARVATLMPVRQRAVQSARAMAISKSSLATIRTELDSWRAQASWNDATRQHRGETLYEDFEGASFEGWQISGQSFGDRPAHELPTNQAIPGYQGQGIANSFAGGSDKLVGSLTSRKFKLPKLFVHVLMGGSLETQRAEKANLRFTLVTDGHKSEHLHPKGKAGLGWMSVRLSTELGRLGYFEIVDRSTTGHIVVDQIVLSDSKEPPKISRPPAADVLTLLSDPAVDSLEALAADYQDWFVRALSRRSRPQWMLVSLSPTGRMEDLAHGSVLQGLGEQRRVAEANVPESTFATIAEDEDPHDVSIHIRGNHKNLGEMTPRQFLQVIAGTEQRPVTTGSGRLELARRMVSSNNPLPARVMVNRIWEHHFGRGIVRSVDNFGKMGERPTHPELLNFLAREFITNGWSIKAMHRLMVLSSSYAMSSAEDPAAAKADPENRWLHHAPVRRLEAETIRDSILAVAGTLDAKLFGRSVPPHISTYQDGRGKPKSGPLDGDRRRSIYIQVRRNFLTPLFLAFDYPLPTSTIGQRSVSTVPSQALMMMNNEFVASQATAWAKASERVSANPEQRIRAMFLQAFGRPALAGEVNEVLRFTESQRSRYQALNATEGDGPLEQRVWADVAHVLLNSAEFIYVR